MKRLLLLLACSIIFCFKAFAGEQLFPDKKYSDGFYENKGQIVDQYGNIRSDVLYIYDKNGFKLHLKYNNFSYELYTIETNYTETELAKYEGLPEFARFKPDMKFHSHRIDIEFVGGNEFPQVLASGVSSDYSNYYYAYTPNEGVNFVYNYVEITYKDIYPNIDIVFHVNKEDDIEIVKYDFIIHPGGNITDIKMLYKGADNLTFDVEGALNIHTSQGIIKENIPKAYLLDNGQGNSQEQIEVHYEMNGNMITFISPAYNSQKTLVIDPEIVWGSYFGDTAYDIINAVQHDALNNILAVGSTASRNNIATSGVYQTTYGGGTFDAFLLKFDRTGSRLWSTYVGGDSLDVAYGVAADNVWHSIYIMGYTSSRNGLSSEGAHQEEYGMGYFDGFIGKFSQLGQREWCTYYGGGDAHGLIGGEYIFNAAIDERFGDIYLTGVVSSRDSMVTDGAHQTRYGGNFDAILAKFDSDGELDWATYYGGEEFDGAYGITLDPSGYITIGGYTASENQSDYDEEIIATENAYKTALTGGSDAFIARFNLRGTRQWGTYFGGTGSETVEGTAADKDKNVYLTGKTDSQNGIATSGAYQTTKNESLDGFIAKFTSSGDIAWATYYGGKRYDHFTSIACNSNGDIVAAGFTTSKENISSSGAFQETFIGIDTTIIKVVDGETFEEKILLADAFLVSMTPSGSRIWASYFAGRGWDECRSVEFDLYDNIIIAGKTSSTYTIASPGTYMTSYAGNDDGFIAKIGAFIRVSDISTPFCVGNAIKVEYETGTEFNSGNVFTAQLSDSTGDFSSPIDIGSVTRIGDGTIDAVIPIDTPPASAYRIRVMGSNPTKTSADNGYDITINPLPEPVIEGDSPACSRKIITYAADIGTTLENVWTVEGGTIMSDSTSEYILVAWDDVTSAKIKVVQTNSETGCIDSVEQIIDVNITPEPFINGETSVLFQSDEIYNTQSFSQYEYLWEVIGGEIIGDAEQNSIIITWGSVGSGSVKLIITDKRNSCKDSLTISIAINSSPFEISGNKTVCSKSEENYSISPENNVEYSWEVTSGEITDSSIDSLITILWGDAGTGVIQLIRNNTESQEIDTVIQNISILELPEVKIFGSDELCEGFFESYTAINTENLSFKWIVYNGVVIGSDSSETVEIEWGEITSPDSLFIVASVTLEQTSSITGCTNSKTKIVFISKKPSAEILGDFLSCENNIESYTTEYQDIGMINEWYVTGGTIIGSSSDSSLQVEWGIAGMGMLKLIQTSSTNCIDSMVIEISINQIPDQPTIKQSGTKLVSSADEGNQWYSGTNLLTGETSKEYTPDTTGYYKVQIIDENGCVSEMSLPYFFDTNVGVKDFNISKKTFKVYPNPTNGILYIEKSNHLNKLFSFPYILKVRDISGKTVITKEIAAGNNQISKLDISVLANGVYIIQLSILDEIYNYRIIKE